eukprot:820331-Pelagomonas_calceolata.AAC.1
MDADSSPGREYTNDRGKRQTENVVLPFLTDLFRLLLSAGVLPQAWKKTRITPLYKRDALSNPKYYRMLAINGCIYRLYAFSVAFADDLLCPTSTIQDLK